MSEEEYELYFDGDLKRDDFLKAESEVEYDKRECNYDTRNDALS